MLRVREAKETPAEYLAIDELPLSGEADFPAMAVATAVAMAAAAASCLGGSKARLSSPRRFSHSLGRKRSVAEQLPLRRAGY